MGAETTATTETTTVSTTTLLEPNDNDVLSGRGGLTNHHPGNKKYRKWVEDHKEKYRQGTMNQKTTIAKQIIHMVKNQDPPGRFLKRDNRNNPWFELDDEKAEKKTKQALRENKDTPETPAVDPTAPKLIYGDALMMAPPKLVTAEVRQNSFHMVEAYVNCDHLAAAASVREHSLGAEELLVGDKLEVARDFSWGSANPNHSASSDLISPIPYKPAMSRAQQFQMMELRKLREQFANDDSDEDLKTAFHPQQQQEQPHGTAGTAVMHGVNPSIAIQWASRGTQLDASNPHMYSAMPTATATMHTASSSSLQEDMAMLQYDDDDVYDPAELMAAPIDSPFPSANGGAPHRKSFVPDGAGSLLQHRPDIMAKRATSNQCETEETRSSYHQDGSVKRVALNRDNSSTANRLKAMYLPGTVSIDSQMRSLNVSMQQSTLRTNAAIDVDAKSIDNNSSMEFDPIPLDNNSVMDSSNGSDFLTESAALALLQASHSPGAKSTQASLESVDEEEAPEQVQPPREESMSLETMIPLADPAKPSSLGRTDRMSTDQYVKAIEGSLGSVGSDSLGKFVDQVLANPDRVLMRGMPPSFGSWRESIPDDDDDHDDDFADDEASARGQQEQ